MRKLGVALSLVLTLGFISCASFQPAEPPKETDFSIPEHLMNQFEVKEEPLPAPAPPAPAPPATAGKLGKKATKAATPIPAKKAKAKAPEVPKSRWERPIPFHPGERLVLDVTYFGAIAGELEVFVLPHKYIKGRKVFHFRAQARTASVFSLFYRLNDVGESYMDAETIDSHKFTLKLDESLQQRDVIELYDHSARKVYYWSKLDHKKKGKHEDQFEIPIEPFTQDAISGFFFIRTLPLVDGEVYRFPVITNGKMREVQITVVRRELLPTKLGDIPAIVVKPEVLLDGVLKKSGDTFIWLSDDDRRSFLKIDAKIKVGSVVAYLRELEHGTPEPAPQQP